MMPRLRPGNASFAGRMPDLLALPFLICAVVAFIAGMVRGFAGFGAAMVMTPVFSALYGPAVGMALCLLLEIVVVLPLLPGVVRLVDWRRIGLLLVAAAVGVPIGNLVLTRSEPEPMRWAISAIVLGAVILLASGWHFSGRPRTVTTLAAGASSGFLNGLSGMAGPPIAFYYLAGDETVTRVRANLTTYFVFVDLLALVGVRRPRPGRLEHRRAGALPGAGGHLGRSAGRAAVSAGQRGLLSPSCTGTAGRRGDRRLDPVSENL